MFYLDITLHYILLFQSMDKIQVPYLSWEAANWRLGFFQIIEGPVSDGFSS